jgi:tRNA(Ile)-lysidine synthetase-like protein
MIIVGVSGGVDSMVLLDLLYKSKQKIVLAHINYHQRDDADLDFKVIKDYLSDKEDIVLETLDVTKYKEGNFEAQARQIRYDFFVALARKYRTDDIYVAHHYDDYLETYLFQKQRQGLYRYYGLKTITLYQNKRIIRPLLKYSKDILYEYALKRNIQYHEDWTNHLDIYTRNVNRKQLNTLSKDVKDKLYQESVLLNKRTALEYRYIEQFTNIIKVSDFNKMSLNMQRRYLFKYLKNYHVTLKNLDELIRQIKESHNFEVTILNTFLIKSYDKIYILSKKPDEYSYVINNDQDYQRVKAYFKQYQFNLDVGYIKYPYSIRNISEEDLARINSSVKKFNKKLKNDKMPKFLREFYPVVEKDGNLIIL